MAHIRYLEKEYKRKGKELPPGVLKYEVRWRSIGANGGPKFHKQRFRTEAEAKQKKRDEENRAAQGLSTDPTPGKQPFSDWADRWLASLEGKKKPSTLRAYRSILENSVRPVFGHRRIASITPADIDEWLTGLRTKGSPKGGRPLTPPTIHRHYGVLRLVLKYAARLNAITNNPAVNVELPTDKSTGRSKPDPVFLTTDQVNWLAAQLEPPYDLLVRFLAFTGLRVAECSGLNVGDVDLAAGKPIAVRRTRTKVAGGWEEHITKNGKPRRVPLLDPDLAADMAAHLENHPNKHDPDSPLFPGTAQLRVPGESGGQRVVDWDKPWSPGVFYKRQYKRALAAAGLPHRTRLHDLRHTAASLMLAAGIPPYRVAEYLGHSLQVLMATYAHVMPDSVNDDAARFAAAFAGDGKVVPLHRGA